MTELSERIPAADEYLRALGRAAYNFAYLEWGIIWLTKTLQPSFLQDASSKTAGQIAKCFSKAAERLDDTQSSKFRLRKLASDFAEIVDDRNSLMHGKPHTDQTGEQRLLYTGRHGRQDWTIELMTEFSSRLEAAAIEAGDLLHSDVLQQCRVDSG